MTSFFFFFWGKKKPPRGSRIGEHSSKEGAGLRGGFPSPRAGPVPAMVSKCPRWPARPRPGSFPASPVNSMEGRLDQSLYPRGVYKTPTWLRSRGSRLCSDGERKEVFVALFFSVCRGGKKGVQGPRGLESGSFKPQERAAVTPPAGREGASRASLPRKFVSWGRPEASPGVSSWAPQAL